MICKNCGSENFAENASVCGICNLPLDGTNTVAIPKQENAGPGVSDEPKMVSSEDDQDDKIDLSDPIDFIMNQPESEVSPLNKDKIDSSAEHTQSLEAESVNREKDDFNLLDTNTDSSKQKTELNPPLYSPKPVVIGAGNSRPDLDDTYSSVATKKISTKDIEKKNGAALDIQRPSTEKIEMPRVAKSRGVILLSGQTLILTGGTRVFNGDDVRIGDQLLKVRPKPKSYTGALVLILTLAIIAAAITAYFGGYIPLGNGQLIGVVLGPGNYPVSDITVRIVENSQSVTTNQAGFFVFDGLDSGLYTVHALKNGEPVIEERIAVLDKEITTITLFESK